MPTLQECIQYHGEEWRLSRQRKAPTTCLVTGKPIIAGDRVYEPVNGSKGRQERILAYGYLNTSDEAKRRIGEDWRLHAATS